MALTLKRPVRSTTESDVSRTGKPSMRTRPSTGWWPIRLSLEIRGFSSSVAALAGWPSACWGRCLPSVNYLGVDISPVMINIATSRLTAWAERAKAVLVDGSLPLPADDGFADRVLSTFVFDLLDEDYARAVLDDLRRILTHDGRLCVASLTHGRDRLLERAVSRSLDRPVGSYAAIVGRVSPHRP